MEDKQKQNDLVKLVAEAIESGVITLEELSRAVQGSRDVPETIINTLHALFCTRTHSDSGCKFYADMGLVNRKELSSYKKWEGLARLYLETFNATVEDLREEVRFLREVLFSGPSKPKHIRLMSLYLTLFALEGDEKLAEFTETFVKNLNKD